MTANEPITPAAIRQQDFPLEVILKRTFGGVALHCFMQENQTHGLIGRWHSESKTSNFRTIASRYQAMKANAQKEAEILIHEAELKAERILQEAFSRQGKIRNDIDE
jgi:hypothetical protein